VTHITKNETIKQFNNAYSSYKQSYIIPDLYKFTITNFIYGKPSLIEDNSVDRGAVNIPDVTSFAVRLI